MKILYHHRIRSLDGQYVHMQELIGSLRALGCEVVISGPHAVATKEFGASAGFVDVLKRALPGWLYESMELAYSVVDFMRLFIAVVRHRPDVIYERYNLFLPSGIWIKKLFGLCLLLEVNAPLYAERLKYNGIALRGLARWTERYVWQAADGVLPVTQVLADMLRAQGVVQDKILVIPNAIDPEKFTRVTGVQDLRQRLGITDRLVIGFTGFVREWHGLERVVDFVADHPDRNLHLLIVGDGPARAGIEARATGRGVADQVTLTGIIGRDEVPTYVAAFDVALQPEVVAYASPLKLFEYLAAGRAIIAPATPNLTEVLTHDENAVLFDAEDEAGFSAALEMLCGDAGLRERMGAGAGRTIDRLQLTWGHNAERVIQQFQLLMDAR